MKADCSLIHATPAKALETELPQMVLANLVFEQAPDASVMYAAPTLKPWQWLDFGRCAVKSHMHTKDTTT